MHFTFSRHNNSLTFPHGRVVDIKDEYLTFIPSNLLVLYWYDKYGEIVYSDGTGDIINQLDNYDQYVKLFEDELERCKIENERKRKEDEEKKKLEYELLQEQINANRDFWSEFRRARNKRLAWSDWSQLSDVSLTDEKKELWVDYRQKLRDLTNVIEDPKPLVLDFYHPDWPEMPS